MKLAWIFAASVAAFCFDLGSASVTYETELNKFLEFKIKYNKIYKNEVEEKLRMSIFIENKASDNTDHFHADKLAHELESDVETLSDNEEFEAFKKTYSKGYESENVEKIRQMIFRERKNKIDEHNSRYAKGLETYKMGINQFSDMLISETQSLLGLNNFRKPESSKFTSNFHSSGHEFLAPINENVPSDIDWRTFGAVTDVKSQGHCGSYWTFASTAALESQYFLRNKTLISLSAQNIVDCARENSRCSGCCGGDYKQAFSYIMHNGGINSETSYPYEDDNNRCDRCETHQCRFNRNNVAATMSTFKTITTEEMLKNAVGKYGPVAAGIHACESFHQYRSGVYYDSTCDKKKLNHDVVVIGYGTDPEFGEYWLIKNSWSPYWGDDGFARIARNRNNNAGIGTDCGLPLI